MIACGFALAGSRLLERRHVDMPNEGLFFAKNYMIIRNQTNLKIINYRKAKRRQAFTVNNPACNAG
jgi:hypothetical protein